MKDVSRDWQIACFVRKRCSEGKSHGLAREEKDPHKEKCVTRRWAEASVEGERTAQLRSPRLEYPVYFLSMPHALILFSSVL